MTPTERVFFWGVTALAVIVLVLDVFVWRP